MIASSRNWLIKRQEINSFLLLNLPWLYSHLLSPFFTIKCIILPSRTQFVGNITKCWGRWWISKKIRVILDLALYPWITVLRLGSGVTFLKDKIEPQIFGCLVAFLKSIQQICSIKCIDCDWYVKIILNNSESKFKNVNI